MGTRGIVGVVADKQEKISYNHYDSYPEGLGIQMLGAAQRIADDFENSLERAKKLKLVREDKPPTRAQIKKLEKFSNTAVSSGKITEWYVLLRDLQGDILGTLDCGFMIDSHEFAQDSLFCEYGWVIDMDLKRLECYRGFVKSTNPPPKGRFYKAPRAEPVFPGASIYQCIHLLGQFPLQNLPDEEKFLQTLTRWYKKSEKYFGEVETDETEN